MNVGSLFAGIGGFDLGLQRCGMRVLWQVEVDPFCRSILERHFPAAQRFKDVRDVGAENLALALDAARELARANPGGAYEIRPIAIYVPERGAA